MHPRANKVDSGEPFRASPPIQIEPKPSHTLPRKYISFYAQSILIWSVAICSERHGCADRPEESEQRVLSPATHSHQVAFTAARSVVDDSYGSVEQFFLKSRGQRKLVRTVSVRGVKRHVVALSSTTFSEVSSTSVCCTSVCASCRSASHITSSRLFQIRTFALRRPPAKLTVPRACGLVVAVAPLARSALPFRRTLHFKRTRD